MVSYKNFISEKLKIHATEGVNADISHYPLFEHQHALTRWALRKGRAAIFADTGLGKTRCQLAWADTIHRKTNSDVLILAPLAVAEQTCEEGKAIGIEVIHAREAKDIKSGINITNYDRLHKFDPKQFNAVVLDESGIIKHHTSKTLRILIDSFAQTKYKLCATATPAPNDWTELGTHAEFLGICSRSEMLAEYFTHDGGETQKWRLKGHAKGAFWRWVSSWGAMLRTPEDLGFDGSAYILPPLNIHEIKVSSNAKIPQNQLFMPIASTLSERRQARRDSMLHRILACADIIEGTDDPWLIWCELNKEQDHLESVFNGSALSVRGSDTIDNKERAIYEWLHGKKPIMISKPKIMGFGLNFQHCANVAFIGAIDSFESYYQAVRRCWRFGQNKNVNVYIFVSEQEGAVLANLKRKEEDAKQMYNQLSQETMFAVREEVLGQPRVYNKYDPKQTIVLPKFMRD